MDFSLIKQLMALNIAIYKNETIPGWNIINTFEHENGLFMCLYKKDKTVLVIRGTDNKIDVNNDRAMIIDKAPAQSYHAQIIYDKIKDPNIIFTGHSLGASLANFLCQQYGNKTISFAPYGGFPKGHANCINIGSEADLIYTIDIHSCPGVSYLIPYSKSRCPLIKDGKIIKSGLVSRIQNYSASQHFIQNWEDVTKMVKYK